MNLHPLELMFIFVITFTVSGAVIFGLLTLLGGSFLSGIVAGGLGGLSGLLTSRFLFR